MRFDVAVDLRSCCGEEWADEGEGALADADLGGRFELGEAATAAEQVEERRLGRVASVVAEDDSVAAVFLADSGEELVAGVAGGGFEGKFLFFCEGADVGLCLLVGEVQFRC